MPNDKKIIVDEDWKSQVQAEKEQAAQARPTASTSGADTSQNTGDMPMPPASFELLLTMLATEALVAMGHVPHPATGKAESHLGQAHYLIDTLEVLRDKTQGNLSPGEQQLIESLLHQLRLAYVEAASAPGAAPHSESR